MTVKIRIPAQLRNLTDGLGEVEVDGASVGEALASLTTKHPAMQERLFDESGKLRRFVNVFLGDEDVRFLDGLDTKLQGGETLSVVPAVAGG
jgi:molybdopterin synthase sulfur carrier subunit